MIRSISLACWLVVAFTNTLRSAVIFPINSDWKYLKGLAEASDPVGAWRMVGFDDATWTTAPSPFWYGDVQPSPGTQLTDMRGNYTCIFMRQTFELNNAADVSELQLGSVSDDGYIVWVNGVEVNRYRMPGNAGDPVAYTGVALAPQTEPIPFETYVLGNPRAYLVPGKNVIAVQAFNASLGDSSDLVINLSLSATVDTQPPSVATLIPSATATVRDLRQIEVDFSEAVTGVNATDLLINGSPATNAVVYGPDQYVFQFPQPATGRVEVAWAGAHGIRDLASTPNVFPGGSWNYTLDPSTPIPGIMISEFMAENKNSLHDEDGDSPDWIELFNPTGAAVSLKDWGLTDDPSRLMKWRFPNVNLLSKGYLVVFASEKNRTNPAARLHTNFKLSSSGEFLALVDPRTNVVSEFAPIYPDQQPDISYGRDRVAPEVLGYFLSPTPGAANSTSGAGFAPKVQFGRDSGTFSGSFLLTLATASSNALIYYTLDGSAPTNSSLLYAGAITMAATRQVRARAFEAGLLPGPIRSESYLQLNGNVLGFSSDLPVVVIHNFGAGAVPASPDQAASISIFEPGTSRSSLTNPPVLANRAGLNIRGSSTEGIAKRSFALEFWNEFNDDRNLDVLGMPSQSDWVLYAPNNFEPVLMHNPFIYRLSNEMGRYAPRTRFVELYINTTGGAVQQSDYNGIYVLMEKIKRDPHRVDIDELAPENTTAPTVTGGYLLKIDRQDANERSFGAAGQTIVYQEPKGPEIQLPERDAQEQYIINYFNAFGTALDGANFTSPVNGYAAFVEVDSWIDHSLLNVLAFNVDALRLSGFFFKPRNGKINMGPIWDFDRSLGSTDGRDANPRVWRSGVPDYGTDFFNFPWWGRMFSDTNFLQRYVDRYQELRAAQFSTNFMFGLIDGFANQVRAAQVREQQRWPGLTTPRGGSYQAEVNLMKNWLRDRVNFMDTNFLARPVLSKASGQVSPGAPLTLNGPVGATIYYTLDGSDPRLSNGQISPAAQTGGGPITLNNITTVKTRARNLNHSNLTGPNNPPVSTPWSGLARGRYSVYAPVSTGTVAVTEIQYHPAPPTPSELAVNPLWIGDDFEFLELKNITANTLDLFNARFTQGIDYSFTTSSVITLPAGGTLLLVKNQAAFNARYGARANIAGAYAGNLDDSGEVLRLEKTSGELIFEFEYRDGWLPITDGFGFSLVLANENAASSAWGTRAAWRPSAEQGGSPGQADPTPAPLPTVVINEALTHTDLPQLDSIELYNPTATAADVGGWFLTDDLNTPRKFRIPNGRSIPVGGYLVFDETDFNPQPPGANSFSLSSLGDEVYLFSADQSGKLKWYLHGFDFGPAENGISFGRHVISTGADHFVAQMANSLGSANAGPRVGPVVISEIMYHPPDLLSGTNLVDNTDDEFIELHNITDRPAPLFHTNYQTNSWRLRDAVDYRFPTNITVPPHGFLLVVGFDPATNAATLAAFRSRNGVAASAPIFGPFQGKLDNSEESVELARPDAPQLPPSQNAGFVPYILVDKVKYSDALPWPIGADGAGPSLQRVDSTSYGNDPANWVSASKTPGAAHAGGTPPLVTQQPASQTVPAGSQVSVSITVSGSDPLAFQWQFNGAALPGATNSTLAISNAQASNAGAYQVAIRNRIGLAQSETATLTVTASDADTDHDGLPDAWEIAHGLNPNDPNDAQADPDNDRMTNLEEYQAGTDPRRSTSFLKLEAMSVVPDEIVLSFSAVSNKTYTIQASQTVSGTPWDRLADFGARPTNRMDGVTVRVTGGAGPRFFRLITPRSP